MKKKVELYHSERIIDADEVSYIGDISEFNDNGRNKYQFDVIVDGIIVYATCHYKEHAMIDRQKLINAL